MAIVVSQSTLARGLRALLPVVQGSPVLPILANVKLEWRGRELRLTTSSQHQTLSLVVEAETTDEGATCIPAKTLAAVVAALPEQPLTLRPLSTFGLEVESENGRYKFDGENPIDWPKGAALNEPTVVQLPVRVLHEAAHQTLYCTAASGYRATAQGVLLRLAPGRATFVATDYSRLAEYVRTDESLKALTEQAEALVPATALQLASKFFPEHDPDGLVTLTFTKKFLVIGDDNGHRLTSVLFDDRYPDYRGAWPTGPGVRDLVFERRCLLDMARRLGIVSSTFYLMLLPNRLLLATATAKNYLENDAFEAMNAEYVDAPALALMPTHWLIEALEHLPTERVKVKLVMNKIPNAGDIQQRTIHTMLLEPTQGRDQDEYEQLALLITGQMVGYLNPSSLYYEQWETAVLEDTAAEAKIKALMAEMGGEPPAEPEPAPGSGKKGAKKAPVASEA